MLEDTAVNGSMLYVCSLIDDGTSESKLAPCTAVVAGSRELITETPYYWLWEHIV